MAARCFLVGWCCFSLAMTAVSSFSRHPIILGSAATRRNRHRSSSSTHLALNAGADNNSPESKEQPLLGRKQGVYTRPSGAIERGSGFYFPGLEGPKVRLVFGSILLLAIGINHIISSTSNSSANSTPLELLSIVYATLVLLQGIVQYRREENKAKLSVSRTSDDSSATIATEDDSSKTQASIVSYEQTWSVPVQNNADWKRNVEWAAATYTALTPATHFVLLAKESIIFSFGRTLVPNTVCEAAISTIAQSKTGRVALPSTHFVVLQLDPNYRKTVILQRVSNKKNKDDENLCLLIASDQLLAAFSTTDLEWLGNMAKFISITDTE